MKQLLLLSLFFLIGKGLKAQYPQPRYQRGYYKPSSGIYVQPHMKTSINSTNRDNYSTRPNYNPYSGRSGSRAGDYTTGAYNYGSGQQIYTGSRGGQYYINSRGNRTYVPKR
jgi:hypothetical protein